MHWRAGLLSRREFRGSVGATLAIVITVATGCAPSTPPITYAVARVLPTVVRIEAIRLSPRQGRMVKSSVTGSGAIFTPEGHVLTNFHVVDNAEHFTCHLDDGTSLPAKRVGQDALTDLAVLRLDLRERAPGAGPLPVAAFGDSDRLRTGDVVFAIGSPASLAQAVTRGVVSNAALVLPDEIRLILDGENVGLLVRWILHDASIFPGNSGGPLVNADGEIVGINEIGVARLGGAIPGNFARAIATELVARGRVIRGWSGLTLQPRLKRDGDGPGVLVGDVAPDSPAAQAGIHAGDILVGCQGAPLTVGGEAAVAAFYRAEAGAAPVAAFAVELQDAGGQRRNVTLTLQEREPAQQPEIELRAWGAVFRDLTRTVVRDNRLTDATGVWIENVRPGGPAGQADPELKRGDVVIAVDGEPVANLDALQAVTRRLVPAEDVARTVLARVRRIGAELDVVLELRLGSERTVTPQNRRAWLGVAVQPLTAKLAAQLKVSAEAGARITEVFPETNAAAAGLKVGDVVLAIDGASVTARRAEDTDAFARQIRQYRPDTDAVLTLWRDGAKVDAPVTLERQPVPPAEMPALADERIEFTVREIAFDDRARLRLAQAEIGLLVESVIASGWAALAGIKADDLIVAADGRAVTDLSSFRTARDAALAGDELWWILQLKRADQTLFVEINLATIRS